MRTSIHSSWTNGMAGTLVPAVPALVIILAIAMGTVVGPDPVHAGQYDDLEWITAVGTVTIRNQTIPEAEEQALALARAQAIAEVTGIQIHSVTERVQQETGETILDQFRQVTSAESSGYIVEESDPSYSYNPLGGSSLQLVCEIQARVVAETQEPDSSFKLLVNLKDRENKTYLSGEEMILQVRSTRDCYLTVFNVYSDGTVALLLPNKYMTDNRLRADKAVEIPNEEQRKSNIHYRVTALPDREITEEYIFVVATRENHPFLSDRMTNLGGNFINTFKADPTELSRWLLKIPRSERTRAEAFYSIVP